MATWSPLTRAGSVVAMRSVSSLQSITEFAGPWVPSGLLDGIWLDDVGAIMPALFAPAGQTLTGAGSLRGYYLPDGASSTADWVRIPRMDEDCSDLAGLAGGYLQAQPITMTAGRFAWICDGVGLSSGTQATLKLWACSKAYGVPL